MKWSWETAADRRVRRRKKRQQWTRVFAFLPKRDLDTRTTYWLQFVWRRATKFYGQKGIGQYDDPSWPSYATVFAWEYRDGNRDAPFIKECPLNLTPSVVLQDELQCGVPDAPAAEKPEKVI